MNDGRKLEKDEETGPGLRTGQDESKDPRQLSLAFRWCALQMPRIRNGASLHWQVKSAGGVAFDPSLLPLRRLARGFNPRPHRMLISSAYRRRACLWLCSRARLSASVGGRGTRTVGDAHGARYRRLRGPSCRRTGSCGPRSYRRSCSRGGEGYRRRYAPSSKSPSESSPLSSSG